MKHFYDWTWSVAICDSAQIPRMLDLKLNHIILSFGGIAFLENQATVQRL
jgi:hypothetical protein